MTELLNNNNKVENAHSEVKLEDKNALTENEPINETESAVEDAGNEDTMNLGIKFFDPWDTDNIASSIAEMEKECDERARNLPSREVIKSYTIKSKYMDVYRLIKNTWGL